MYTINDAWERVRKALHMMARNVMGKQYIYSQVSSYRGIPYPLFLISCQVGMSTIFWERKAENHQLLGIPQ